MHSRKAFYVSIVGLAALQDLRGSALSHVAAQLQQFSDISEIPVNVCRTVPDVRRKVHLDTAFIKRIFFDRGNVL